MARALRIGGAQMGPIQKAESRQVVVRRMLDLLETAKSQGCDLVVYPEARAHHLLSPLVHDGSRRG